MFDPSPLHSSTQMKNSIFTVPQESKSLPRQQRWNQNEDEFRD